MAQSGGEAVPPGIRAGFAAVQRANALRNLRLAGELTLIVKAFHSRGLKVASLKGPALAQEADGSSSFRIIADLDLLIRPHESATARAIVEERGFRVAGSFLFSHKDDVFTRASDASVIELHRALHDEGLPLPLPLGPMFDRLASVPLLATDIPVLPLEENLLYLAYHGAKHGWSRLTWLTALLNLIDMRRAEIDAERLHARARELGIEKMLALALHLGWQHLAFETEDWPRLRLSARDRSFAGGLFEAAFAEGSNGGTVPGASLLGFAARVLDGSATTPSGTPVSTSAIDALLKQRRADGGWRRVSLVRGIGGRPLTHLAHKLLAATPPDVRLFGVSPERRTFYAVVRPPLLLLRSMARRVARLRRSRIAQPTGPAPSAPGELRVAQDHQRQ